jgi:hypothetical protein
MRSANDDVQRKRWIDGHADLHRLIELVFGGHHDENIYIAVCMRLSIRVRSEQDDLVGPKSLRDLLCETSDGGFRHVLPAVKGARTIHFRYLATHIAILPRVSARLLAN